MKLADDLGVKTVFKYPHGIGYSGLAFPDDIKLQDISRIMKFSERNKHEMLDRIEIEKDTESDCVSTLFIGAAGYIEPCPANRTNCELKKGYLRIDDVKVYIESNRCNPSISNKSFNDIQDGFYNWYLENRRNCKTCIKCMGKL